jgi:hypothetical protein
MMKKKEYLKSNFFIIKSTKRQQLTSFCRKIDCSFNLGYPNAIILVFVLVLSLKNKESN